MTERERLIELMTQAENKELSLLEFEKKILADYLLKNGVIVLPVKIGQTVYYIFDGFIEPCTVEVIFLSDYEDKYGNCTYMADIHFDRDDSPFTVAEIYFTDIGKTVFLTKEEAEQTLQRIMNK